MRRHQARLEEQLLLPVLHQPVMQMIVGLVVQTRDLMAQGLTLAALAAALAPAQAARQVNLAAHLHFQPQREVAVAHW
jgi:hypothetical protein